MKRYKNILVYLCCFIVLFLIYLHIAFSIPHNSDNASVLLEGLSMKSGNLFLRGWYMPPDNHISTEVPIYAIAEKISGLSPSLMGIIPAAMFTLVVLLCCIFSSWGKRGKEKVFAFILVITIIGTPGAFLAQESLVGPIHMGTILFVLLAYLFYILFLQQRKNRIWTSILLIIFFMLSLAAFLGDPLALPILALPVTIISLVRIYHTRKIVSRNFLALVFIICAVMIANILEAYLVRTGTHIVGTTLTIAPLELIGGNMHQALVSILDLSGSPIFGQPIFDKTTPLILLHGIIYLGAIVGIIVMGKKVLKNFSIIWDKDNIATIFWIAAMGDLLAFVFSTYPQGDITNARYLLPLFFFSGIVGARVIAEHIILDRLDTILVIGLAFISIIVFIHHAIQIKPYTEPERNVVSYLTSHSLTRGYGQYWASAIITVYAHGNITVRQVDPSNTDIVGYRFLSNEEWFHTSEKHRFIITSDFFTPQGYLAGIEHIIGPYNSSYTALPYHVYVWNVGLPDAK